MRVCKDCGETLIFYPEHGEWAPKRDNAMGYSCRVRYGKVCNPDPPVEGKSIVKHRDPYTANPDYPDTHVA